MRYFNTEDQKRAAKSSRSTGSVGRNPKVYRYLKEPTQEFLDLLQVNDKQTLKKFYVLDFGAGKGAVHTLSLRKDGFQHVTAYDFPDNSSSVHDEFALGKEYEIVLASNVLNVQGSKEMLEKTLRQIILAMSPGGVAIMNYPKSPRYLSMSNLEMVDTLRSFFSDVVLLEGKTSTKQDMVLLCFP